jgi:menaquinone-dependent protoporphyrinogen oxidase
MNVLIAVASRHGSTVEIAATIAEELRQAGHKVDVRSVDDEIVIQLYDAAIIGSAVYMGHWLAEARHFLDREWEQLRAMPVWLFSSGPTGTEDAQPKREPVQTKELLEATHARDHQIFGGKLDKHEQGLGARLVLRMVKAPEGDFRDWNAIRQWAREIAAALQAAPVAAGGS